MTAFPTEVALNSQAFEPQPAPTVRDLTTMSLYSLAGALEDLKGTMEGLLTEQAENNARVTGTREQIAELVREHRRRLDEMDPPHTSNHSPTLPRTRGRPKGNVRQWSVEVMDFLRRHPSSLSSDVWVGLRVPEDRRTIVAATLRNLCKTGKLSRTGKDKSFRYSLP